jgi:energy-coupling factor transporter transmembrane protein EcfT
LSAALIGLAAVTCLGPAGFIAGLTSLGLPQRLVAIAHGMLVSMSAILRQASGMLRAREARGVGAGPWRPLLGSPVQTQRWVGRLIGALLLRSVERAEALDRARRARALEE